MDLEIKLGRVTLTPLRNHVAVGGRAGIGSRKQASPATRRLRPEATHSTKNRTQQMDPRLHVKAGGSLLEYLLIT